MKKKFCGLYNKVVYAEKCLECGKLQEVDGELEAILWDCEHLFLKSVYVGPTTDQEIRKADRDNMPVGAMRKYQYTEFDMRTI